MGVDNSISKPTAPSTIYMAVSPVTNAGIEVTCNEHIALCTCSKGLGGQAVKPL